MRKIERIEPFLKELGQIWGDNLSDWRFGQLIYNFIAENGDPFFWEEDEFLKRFKAWVEKLKEPPKNN